MRERLIRTEVYLSETEAKALNEICAVSGKSKSTVLRQMIMGCTIKPRPPNSYKDLARELAAIGNNINQLAHTANATGRVQAQQIQEATDLMRKVWLLVQERV